MSSVYMATCIDKRQNSKKRILVTFGISGNDNPIEDIKYLTECTKMEHTCLAYHVSTHSKCTESEKYMHKNSGSGSGEYITHNNSGNLYYFIGHEHEVVIYDETFNVFEEAILPKSERYTLERFPCPCCNSCSLYLVLKTRYL